MKFIHSLQSEILKVKGSSLFWFSIGGSLLLPLVFIGRYLVIGDHMNSWEVENAWKPLFANVLRPFTGFLLPIGSILICSLITQVEYKNNNWKQVHTTPQSYTTIFLAKYSTLLLLTLMIFFFVNIGALLLGVIPSLILDGSLPNDMIPFDFFFKETMKCFIACLPIIGLQFLISLRFKNFMVAVGVGLTIYIGTIMALKMDMSYLSPYSYVLLYFDNKMSSTNMNYYAMAISYFSGLSIINYVLYLKKKNKG
ncbi:MAG: ABC transporter permease [Flavobacteriales bacterium]|nr:ABC transporter permease [Flavobacteriales bacterium]